MNSLSAALVSLLAIGLTIAGCSSRTSDESEAGWITLLDGSNSKTLDNWNRIGDANWRAEDSAIVADKGKGGHLVCRSQWHQNCRCPAHPVHGRSHFASVWQP